MWLCWIVQYYVGSFISVNIVIDRPIFVGTHCIGISVYFDVDWIWTEIYYIAIKIFEQKNIVRKEQTQNEWMQTTTTEKLLCSFASSYFSFHRIFRYLCTTVKNITLHHNEKNTYGKRWMNRERVKRTKVCERAANKRKSIYKNLPEAAKCQLEHAPYSSINGI